MWTSQAELPRNQHAGHRAFIEQVAHFAGGGITLTAPRLNVWLHAHEAVQDVESSQSHNRSCTIANPLALLQDGTYVSASLSFIHVLIDFSRFCCKVLACRKHYNNPRERRGCNGTLLYKHADPCKYTANRLGFTKLIAYMQDAGDGVSIRSSYVTGISGLKCADAHVIQS